MAVAVFLVCGLVAAAAAPAARHRRFIQLLSSRARRSPACWRIRSRPGRHDPGRHRRHVFHFRIVDPRFAARALARSCSCSPTARSAPASASLVASIASGRASCTRISSSSRPSSVSPRPDSCNWTRRPHRPGERAILPDDRLDRGRDARQRHPRSDCPRPIDRTSTNRCARSAGASARRQSNCGRCDRTARRPGCSWRCRRSATTRKRRAARPPSSSTSRRASSPKRGSRRAIARCATCWSASGWRARMPSARTG